MLNAVQRRLAAAAKICWEIYGVVTQGACRHLAVQGPVRLLCLTCLLCLLCLPMYVVCRSATMLIPLPMTPEPLLCLLCLSRRCLPGPQAPVGAKCHLMRTFLQQHCLSPSVVAVMVVQEA